MEWPRARWRWPGRGVARQPSRKCGACQLVAVLMALSGVEEGPRRPLALDRPGSGHCSAPGQAVDVQG
eukprot:5296632-Pyramimonas_sp.AAC.1